MSAVAKVLEKIKDKLTPKERVVLVYAYGMDCPYPSTIPEIAQLFGEKQEHISKVLESIFKKCPIETQTILNLRKAEV